VAAGRPETYNLHSAVSNIGRQTQSSAPGFGLSEATAFV